MQICQICHKQFDNKLFAHINRVHKMSIKEYYDKYLRKPNDGVCPICGNETTFVRNYYNKCCCQSHSASYRQQNSTRLANVQQFEKEYNCTSANTLRGMYGQGWYKAGIITNYIEASFDTQMFFVHNEDVQKIIDYNDTHKYSNKSHREVELQNYIKFIYDDEIELNTKLVVPHTELDIYLPNLKLAIEYNGNWYHCVENGTSKDYHLNKSIKCREFDIRLIHIYEFENFEEQKKLLYELIINNNDLYNNQDFNKNNLSLIIPKPSKHKLDRYTIYTAGPLYKGENLCLK